MSFQFVSFKCRKSGVERGRGKNRKRYNDSVVAVTLAAVKWEDFKQEVLLKLQNNKDAYLSLATDKGYSLAVAEEAYQKVIDSLSHDRTAPAKFEPSALPDGRSVPNGFKYIGEGEGDKTAIYISGIKVSEVELITPPNGYHPKPTPKNAVGVVVNLMKKALGMEWRQYKVTPFYFSSIQLPTD